MTEVSRFRLIQLRKSYKFNKGWQGVGVLHNPFYSALIHLRIVPDGVKLF
jgi:hypothetical protein